MNILTCSLIPHPLKQWGTKMFVSLKYFLPTAGGIPKCTILYGIDTLLTLELTLSIYQPEFYGPSQVAVQAIDGIRTVTSFNLTDKVLGIYKVELSGCLNEGVRRGLTDGLALGLSQLITLGAYGFIFW